MYEESRRNATKKTYHFGCVIANNKWVIYEPFDSYIIWIGFGFALEMHFRAIQNWWIFQLWRWWWIEIAFSRSHIAFNRKLHFGRVLNLKFREKRMAKLFLSNGSQVPTKYTRKYTKKWPLECFELCLKPGKILLNHNRLVSERIHKSREC